MSPFIAGWLTLALGFAISGLVGAGFEAAAGRRASFRLLREPDVMAVIAVPLVTLAAPYILARGVLRAPAQRRSAPVVMAGTVACGLWSLVLGAAALSAIA